MRRTDETARHLVMSPINEGKCYFPNLNKQVTEDKKSVWIHPKIWGLNRPPSMVCSGTGRLAYPNEIWGLRRPPSMVCSRTDRPACPNKIWGLHRPLSMVCSGTGWLARSNEIWGPQSTVCSGTGRFVCVRGSGLRWLLIMFDSTLHTIERWYFYYFLNLVTRLILCLTTSSGTTSVRCILR